MQIRNARHGAPFPWRSMLRRTVAAKSDERETYRRVTNAFFDRRFSRACTDVEVRRRARAPNGPTRAGVDRGGVRRKVKVESRPSGAQPKPPLKSSGMTGTDARSLWPAPNDHSSGPTRKPRTERSPWHGAYRSPRSPSGTSC
jgi:hypothetical protein